MRTNVSALLSLAILIGAPAISGPGVTFAQALAKHHIALSEASLLEALRNSDMDVRWLAASQLLTVNHDLDAIPSVEDALRREEIVHTKLNMASALAQAGDELGISTLYDACQDTQLDMSMRVRSAEYLLQLGNERCLETVIEAIEMTDESGNPREVALSLVPRFTHLSEADAERLTHAIVDDLASTDAALRAAGSHALAAWAKTSAIGDIERAIRNETNDTVRSEMQMDLT